jgi:hypothetical protein
MRFYKDKELYRFWYYIQENKLTAIFQNLNQEIVFLKKSKCHNNKNAAYIRKYEKHFYLNGNFHGYDSFFSKDSWRRNIKLKVFS